MNKQKLFTAIAIIFIFSSCAYIRKPSEEYYGINIGKNEKVVFVIDISGSMEGKAEKDLKGNVISQTSSIVSEKLDDAVGTKWFSRASKSTSKQLTKLAKAKKELIPAIRGLGEENLFTIIVFENNVKTWKKELVEATGTNKNLALLYLERLEADGGTNISDALEEAFDLAGPGASSETGDLEVETIFLLSDGAPTAGKITSTNGIVEKTGEWNTVKRLKLNTIGLGKDCDKNFMKDLAALNNGKFIDR